MLTESRYYETKSWLSRNRYIIQLCHNELIRLNFYNCHDYESFDEY